MKFYKSFFFLFAFASSALMSIQGHASSMDLEPKSCDEIRDYLSSIENQPKTYNQIKALKPRFQRIAFDLLSPEEQREYIQSHLSVVINKITTLSSVQRAFLANLMNQITLEVVIQGSNSQLLGNLENQARELFTQKEAFIFDIFDFSYENKDSLGAVGGNNAEFVLDMIPDPPKEYACDCNIDSIFNQCSGTKPREYHCYEKASICTKTKKGCGFLGQYKCKGTCFGLYRTREGGYHWVPTEKGRNDPDYKDPPPWEK